MSKDKPIMGVVVPDPNPRIRGPHYCAENDWKLIDGGCGCRWAEPSPSMNTEDMTKLVNMYGIKSILVALISAIDGEETHEKLLRYQLSVALDKYEMRYGAATNDR